MIETIGIPIACVTFAILLLWFIIGTKGQWVLKMLVSAFSVYFCVCLWTSLNGLLGWPTSTSLEGKKVQILWVDVKEPNKKTEDPGSVYVWVKHLEPEKTGNSFILRFHTKNSQNEPRLYKVPYSRKLHEQAEKIKKHLAKGGKFAGQLSKQNFKGEGKGKDGEGQGKGKGQGQGKGKGKGKAGREGKGKGRGKGDGGSLSQDQEFMFHQLPPPRYQSKDYDGAASR